MVPCKRFGEQLNKNKKRGVRSGKKARRPRVRLRALDIFCGAGGSSHGASSAGVQIVGAVDRWKTAVDTYRDNFPRAHVITGFVSA
ncbi:MAG TPA: DNA cytosine methyltransferase [bacterium]|nr:DNA cytosine methyltransferase [bacterium]